MSTADLLESPEHLMNLYAIYSFYAISSVLIFARLYARLFMLKNRGLDDLFAVLAYCCLMAMIATHHSAAVALSKSENLQDLLVKAQEYTFNSSAIAYEVTYFCGSLFVRLSVVALLQRLANGQKRKKTVWAIYAIFGVFVVIISGAVIVSLKSKTLEGQSDRSQAIILLIHAIVFILTDIALFIAPIRIFSTQMIDKAKMIKVVLIFSVGIITCVAGIVRLSYIVRDLDLLQGYKVAQSIYFWTNLEGHTSLWVACFPALQPIIRVVMSRIGFASTTGSGHVVSSSSQRHSRHGYIRQHSNSRKNEDRQQDVPEVPQSGYILQQRSVSSTVDKSHADLSSRSDSFSMGNKTKISADVRQEEVDPAELEDGRRGEGGEIGSLASPGSGRNDLQIRQGPN